MLEGFRKHFMTIFLVGIVIVMISSIFFISFKLKETNNSRSSSIAPIRTKAAQKTYSKIIALKQNEVEPTGVVPTEFNTPTPSDSLGSEEITESPTPTEIIIAYSNPTITGQDIFDEIASTSASPTGVKNLPDAGYIGYPLLIIAIGGLIIFFSFIY